MHCPNCRRDNPATTRFCSACGAVLVESAPDGRRRRVLRPWGLRRSAPPTISPDMPDLIEAADPAPGTRLDPSARFDLWIVAGLVAAVIAAAWFNGRGRSGPDPLRDAAAQVGAPAYVVATTEASVQEARLSAPPLFDVPPARMGPVATRTGSDVASRPRSQAPSTPAAQALETPPPRDGSGDDRSAVAQAPTPAIVVAAAPAVVDRWEALRSAVSRCASASGAIARAMCEQEARLAYCNGFWGLVAACPTARSEYGQ
jgi:hypothetical protein